MPSIRTRLLISLAVFALLFGPLPAPTVTAAMPGTAIGSVAQTSGASSRLSARAEELLAAAIEEGRTSVVIIVATRTGRGDSVARDLAARGAEILSKDNALGYVTALIATLQVKAAAAAADVEIVDLDETFPLEPPVITEGAADETQPFPPAPPGPATPPQNSYMPTRDIGAPQFVAANPTYDGRGVVIGILDTGTDLFTPELQTAKKLDGTPTTKHVDWVTFTHPLVDPDPTWVNMATQVTASGGTFTVGTTTYTAPADGAYRFGVFSESSLGAGSEYGACPVPLPSPPNPPGSTINTCSDLNRDGDGTDTFAFLWDTATNQVFVDTNQNKSFADQSAMTDFKVNGDIGIFGTDNPATAIRETVPFVVQTDGKNKFVNVGIVSGAHATHVAGIAAGKDFFGGAFDGAAPEAMIVSVRVCLFVAGCTARALIDGMVYAAKQSNVDVINMSIGGLPFVNDGNNARARLYDRLIEQANVQMFISAGNSGPGLNTVGDPSVASLVMSVGSYIHKDTWHSNYGNDAVKDDGLHVFTSRGPAEHGGFKPNIVAPGAAVSSTPRWQPGQPVGGTYALPPGYGMFNGTSMAAPQATGGAALIISGAKQAGVQYQPAQLRQAINSTATYLPYYGALEQGNGLMKVGATWALLQQTIKPVEITGSVPVSTLLSGSLATPGIGVGIHDREGVSAGAPTYTRTYTFTRRSGGSRPITYNATWVGNDGTFSGAATVALGHNTPTSYVVTITPGAVGSHSALLNLDDPSTPGIDHQTMNTVVTSAPLDASNDYGVTVAGSADRADTNKPRHFFGIPASTTMIRTTATVLTGRMRMLRQHPFGVPLDNTNTTPYCSAGANCQTGQPPGTVQRTFVPSSSVPATGTWEVTMDASRSAPTAVSTYSITVEAFGVTLSPSSWTVTGAATPGTSTQVFTATNTKRSFVGNMAGSGLSSAREDANVTFTSGSPSHERTINVPSGATRLVVQIFQNPGPTADLDLFLYNCTSGTCVFDRAGLSSTSNETLVVTSPAAGLWKSVVEEFSIPAGTTAYRYLDDITKPGAFGSISVADAPAARPAGSNWSATATANRTGSAGAGRFHRGFVFVVFGSTALAQAEARFIP